MMNQIATLNQPSPVITQPQRRAEIRVVSDPIAVLDTARFEHMQRIATVMAHSNLIPDSLCAGKDENGNKVYLPLEQVTANCFLIVNQSVRWNMDPFAVAQCVSVVHGKLCYEGKLIAAMLNSKLGVDLEYEISGQGDAMKVIVSASVDGKPVVDSRGRPKVVEGAVSEWKTTGKGSPWMSPGGYPRMLRYRGAREWCRIHEPGLMLGVYSDDEMEDLNASHRARQQVAREEPPAPPPAAQIEQKPECVPTPVEELVHVTASAETVEWTDPEPEEPKPADEPPVPDDPPAPPPIPTEPAARTEVVDDFPGDKPMPKSNDGLDIPPYLDRRKQDVVPEEPVNVDEWLQGLEGALSGCESTEQLVEVQNKYQSPMKGKVSKADFARSQSMVMEAFTRISEQDGE